MMYLYFYSILFQFLTVLEIIYNISVKCQKQQRAFYLAVVCSQFEPCAQIWRPSYNSLNQKLERIQKHAVRWILSEQDHSSNDLEYLMRLRDLDLLPLKERFITSDFLFCYDIHHDASCAKLPCYIKHFSHDERRRLRPIIKPPSSFLQINLIILSHL